MQQFINGDGYWRLLIIGNIFIFRLFNLWMRNGITEEQLLLDKKHQHEMSMRRSAALPADETAFQMVDKAAPQERKKFWFISHRYLINHPFTTTAFVVIHLLLALRPLYLTLSDPAMLDRDVWGRHSDCPTIAGDPVHLVFGAFYVISTITAAYKLWRVNDTFRIKRELFHIAVFAPFYMVLKNFFASNPYVDFFVALAWIQILFGYGFYFPLYIYRAQQKKVARKQVYLNRAVPVGQLKPPTPTLENMLGIHKGFKALEAFLKSEFSVENLLFIRDAARFRMHAETLEHMPSEENQQRIQRSAVALYNQYVKSDAPMQINLPAHVFNTLKDLFQPAAPRPMRLLGIAIARHSPSNSKRKALPRPPSPSGTKNKVVAIDLAAGNDSPSLPSRNLRMGLHVNVPVQPSPAAGSVIRPLPQNSTPSDSLGQATGGVEQRAVFAFDTSAVPNAVAASPASRNLVVNVNTPNEGDARTQAAARSAAGAGGTGASAGAGAGAAAGVAHTSSATNENSPASAAPGSVAAGTPTADSEAASVHGEAIAAAGASEPGSARRMLQMHKKETENVTPTSAASGTSLGLHPTTPPAVLKPGGGVGGVGGVARRPSIEMHRPPQLALRPAAPRLTVQVEEASVQGSPRVGSTAAAAGTGTVGTAAGPGPARALAKSNTFEASRLEIMHLLRRDSFGRFVAGRIYRAYEDELIKAMESNGGQLPADYQPRENETWAGTPAHASVAAPSFGLGFGIETSADGAAGIRFGFD